MRLEDVEIGQEYLHERFGRVLLVAPHPHDGAWLIVEKLEARFLDRRPEFDATEADELSPINAWLASLLEETNE